MKYEKYKDSGVEWLGEIPEHWGVTQSKRICKNITDGAHTSPDLSSPDYPFLSVVNLNKGVLDFINCHYTSKDDYIYLVRNGCHPKIGNILFSKDGTIGESILVKDDIEFVVGSSFIIIRPNDKQILSNYFQYFLSSSFIKDKARVFVKGTGIPRLSIFNFSRLEIAIPQLSEQAAIAQYLDAKTSTIDKKIELLTKKIDRYQELRKSLINETVCRGLDKTVNLKESGIEWIGKVPEHWEVERFKDINEIKRGASPRPIDDPIYFDDNGEFSWVRIADLTASERYLETTKEKLSVLGASLSVKRYPNDFILSIAGTVGKPIITKIKCCIHDGFVWFPNLKLNPEFLYYMFTTGLPYQGLGKLGTQLNLNTETIGLISLPMPPKDEINKIVSYLDTQTQTIDNITNNLKKQIDTLKELRKTLINDVVTGKIKVNGDPSV